MVIQWRNAMRFAICDDNLVHAHLLESCLIDALDSDIECDIYQSGDALLDIIFNTENRYDMLFLDIEMDGNNGIETANVIREKDEKLLIVFVTSHSQYMKECFQCMPFRFMMKPVEQEELEEILKAAKKKLAHSQTIIGIKVNKMMVQLYTDDIIFCESTAHYMTIYTKQESYRVRMTMEQLTEMLPYPAFCRVHRSFMVHFKYVKSIKDKSILLYADERMIPIGRNYKNNVINSFTNYMEMMVEG